MAAFLQGDQRAGEDPRSTAGRSQRIGADSTSTGGCSRRAGPHDVVSTPSAISASDGAAKAAAFADAGWLTSSAAVRASDARQLDPTPVADRSVRPRTAAVARM